MIVELITTGSELLLGRVLNTNQQWLCRVLADIGFAVGRQMTVPDQAHAIQEAVREALSRADVVITTGGLGPTSDDMTRDAIAQLLGRTLRLDAAVLSRIETFFAERHRPMPDGVRIQALVPEGARVLQNDFGTAPGLCMELRPNPFRTSGSASWLIMLPGPPRELKPMFERGVAPLLESAFSSRAKIVCRTFRTIGIPESVLQERIEKPLAELVRAGMDVGYCARPGSVDVRFVATGTEADATVRAAEGILREQLGTRIYAESDERMEEVVIRLLAERKETLALAESCTGGYIAHQLTNVPGASAVLLGGFVTYSNSAKQKSLGVRGETLVTHGAVSEPVAREMAEGAREMCQSDYALAVTGIAGPGGGSDEKPVGTVYIALASARGSRVWKRFNPWDRSTFKEVTALQALDLLRTTIVEPHGTGPDGPELVQI